MPKFKIIKSFQLKADPSLRHIEKSSYFLVEFIEGELKNGDKFLLIDAGHRYLVTVLEISEKDNLYFIHTNGFIGWSGRYEGFEITTLND
jgi:hypothetical protein